MEPRLETANERVRALRQALQMTRQEFCNATGIKLTTLENIEKKKQKVHDEHFQGIALCWPEYTFWLVTGKAPKVTQLPLKVMRYVEQLKQMEKSGKADPVAEKVRKAFINDKKRKVD